VEIDHLNAIPPWITKVAAERRLQFEFVFLGKFLPDFLELRFIANHDPEMSHVCSLNFVDFENGEELMVPQFEERVTLAAAHLFEIENILVKRHRLLDIIHLYGDMIASVNLHTHPSVYAKVKLRTRDFLRFLWRELKGGFRQLRGSIADSLHPLPKNPVN
jgi:hypothetical protein